MSDGVGVRFLVSDGMGMSFWGVRWSGNEFFWCHMGWESP